LIQRDHEVVAVRPGLDVGHYPEVRAGEQALAFGDAGLVVVAGGGPVLQPRAASADLWQLQPGHATDPSRALAFVTQ
jgi:hypothetical protein